MPATNTDRVTTLIDVWRRSQVPDTLVPADVARILTADPGLVLTNADRSAAIAVSLRHRGEVTSGHIRLLAVDASVQRRGEASALLTEAEGWLAEHGATQIRWGAEAPWYLWPGIDESWDAALGFARQHGYRRTGEAVNLSLATDFHAPTPPDVEVQRLASAPEQAALVSAARDMVADNWEPWLVEFDLATDSGTLFVASTRGAPVAFLAHSTLRHGWIGPMGTAKQYRGHGIGATLLSAVCADLAHRGVDTAEMVWVGPVPYFERLGARPYRTFAQMKKDLPRS